jgi:hypothetical protein
MIYQEFEISIRTSENDRVGVSYPPMTVISDASVEFNHHIGAPLIGKFKHLAMAVEQRARQQCRVRQHQPDRRLQLPLST